jgi:hypothetical protein
MAAALLMIVAVTSLWNRHELPVPPTPVVAMAHPPAPAVHRVLPKPHMRVRTRRVARERTDPVLIRVVTDNPEVVIYWIADVKGE